MADKWEIVRGPAGEKFLSKGFFTDEDAVFLRESDVAALILFLQTCGETWRRGESEEKSS